MIWIGSEAYLASVTHADEKIRTTDQGHERLLVSFHAGVCRDWAYL